MTPANNGIRGHKTELAKQAIIRYIQDARLEPGARLPSQEELKSILKLSGTTVIRAVNSLKSEGLLEARSKVGVFVRSNDLAGKIGRTVALLPFFENEGISPFFASLALHLQYRLRRVCSQTILFTCRHLERREDFGVADFPGLADAIRDGTVNAVVDLSGLHGASLDFLAQRRIPITYVGAPYMVKNGVIFDLADYCRQALELLFGCGCRQPAVIAPAGYIRSVLAEVAADSCRRHRIPLQPAEVYLEVDAIEQGRQLAREILDRPDSARPDGIVMIDEFIGHDFLTGLALLQRDREDYRPTVVMARNRQLQLAPPRDDVIFFEKDLDEITDLAVDHLLRQESAVRYNPTLVYYRLRRSAPEPFFQETMAISQ